MLIPGEFDSIRLVSDDSYHFDTEIKDGKTEVFHIFEFSNELKIIQKGLGVKCFKSFLLMLISITE
ncbi:hypothetical protein [uncultured Eubacterium sp.]|uniref:hypothetical protein n=1 Tax=uncultured Eubacterium sp. TaxID=165185 RepID=UPI0028054638|nr:hypothetical protein [uncultured Eubacterium sp.]